MKKEIYDLAVALERPIVLPDIPFKVLDIYLQVCIKHHVHPADMNGPYRTMRYTIARRDFSVRCKNELDWPYYRISKAINKDHTTIMHAYKCWQKGKTVDPVERKTKKKYLFGDYTIKQVKIMKMLKENKTKHEICQILGIKGTNISGFICAINDKITRDITVAKLKEMREEMILRRESIEKAAKAYQCGLVYLTAN